MNNLSESDSTSTQNTMSGYCIEYQNGRSTYISEYPDDGKVTLFRDIKYSKSATALAKISQIITNDARFGGPITNEEWDNDTMKYTILRIDNSIDVDENDSVFRVLAFHTPEQRDAFLKEYIDLIKDFLML